MLIILCCQHLKLKLYKNNVRKISLQKNKIKKRSRNMNLIIDTSCEKLVVILQEDKNLYVGESESPKHLKTLLPQIDNVLNKANKKLKDVNTFAVVLGPGSFTGVRIGVATIKGFMSTFTTKKAVGINLFELLSYLVVKNNKVDNDFAIVIKSTATKYYYAHVLKTGEIVKMGLVTSDELQKEVSENKLSLFCYNFNYENLENKKITLLEQDYVEFVANKINKKQFVTITDLKPIYLALSQAEEELIKRQKAENGNS